MPACDRVKEVNTPIAYNGISLWTSAWNRTTSAVEAIARPMMPFEKTRRWPRLVSGRGMKSSCAWKFARRGKSANEVFAARIRISVVAIWSIRNIAVPTPPLPNTARPTSEITVLVSVGVTWSFIARNDSPRNITPSRLPIHISVVRALRHSGGLKAGTPFEIASTPVTAAPPEAKACRIRNRPIAPVVSATSGGMGSGCRSPISPLTIPMPRSRNIMTMKKYVGAAKMRPDSRTPRRFPQAMIQMNATESPTRYG